MGIIINDSDTIAAIATPQGPGAIGIVKISGPGVQNIFQKLFVSKRQQAPILSPKSHHLYHGYIKDKDGEKIDEVLAVLMKSPHSYTSQDVMEIQSHSGPAVLKAILNAVLELGARPAEPGEFTKRAFLNGRIDLSQAEAVLNLSNARTDIQRKAALNLLEGRLSANLNPIKKTLLNVLATIEVAIDFPDEAEEIEAEEEIIKNLKYMALSPLRSLLEKTEHSRIYKEGIRVVICGRPNVGKSSLLNELLNEERAIVTEIPGTTRDVIYESIIVDGIPLMFVDTAGLRQTDDPVEALGVERVRKEIERADVILWLIDLNSGVVEEDLVIRNQLKGSDPIIVLNKLDTIGSSEIEQKHREILTSLDISEKRYKIISISAKTGKGVTDLCKLIIDHNLKNNNTSPPELLLEQRHRDAISKAIRATQTAIGHIQNNIPELAAIELDRAIENIELITGEGRPNELLDSIFSKFCLGK